MSFQLPLKLWKDLETGTYHLDMWYFTSVEELPLIRKRGKFREAMSRLDDLEA